MSIESEATACGDYYAEFEPPEFNEDGTPTTDEQKETYVAAYEEEHGPPPEPPAIPEPPTPGAGMPAARKGDLTAHGGTIGPVVTGETAFVMIGNLPAACMGDPHTCPMFDGPKPHVGGTILKGSTTVTIGNLPAARVSDVTECKGPPGAVALGESTVLIGE
jgi:uncharacterized Zn-binding protein involved in type VI secretion